MQMYMYRYVCICTHMYIYDGPKNAFLKQMYIMIRVIHNGILAYWIGI